jgi:phage baseplate assembly protein W
MPLPSPADLSVVPIAGGHARLAWSYPADGSLQDVRFDVYSGTDPLQPFRTVRVSTHASTSVTLEGFAEPSEHYLVVVARQGDTLSLPSAVARLVFPAVPAGPTFVSERPGGSVPAGLAFPLRIDGSGRVLIHSGDRLLEGKILQLLLTAPGERVNLPEFGTRLRDLVFDPNNDVLAAATEFAVTRALQRFLGDEIRVEQVFVRNQDAEVQVDIAYLRRTDLAADRLRIGIPIPG